MDPARKKIIPTLLLITAVVFIAYSNALLNGFVYDDNGLVPGNPIIKSQHNLPAIFSSDYWAGDGEKSGLYRPLAIFSLAVEYAVAGTNPFLYHLDNVILHLLCSILVLFIARELFNEKRVAAAASLVFAAHPVHTEAVATVFGRAEVLCAFFVLSSFLLFLKRERRKAFYLSLACFFLALLSKESAVVLPLLLALYLLVFHRDDRKKDALFYLKQLYPYALVMVLYLAMRAVFLKGVATPQGYHARFNGVEPFDAFLMMCRAAYEYIRLSFLPFDLRCDYDFSTPSLLDIRTALLPVLIVMMLVFGKRLLNFSKGLFFAVCWFLVALLPVSNIIPTGILMSERALYIPSFGACLLLGLVLGNTGTTGFLGKKGFVLSLVPMIAALSLLTFTRNAVWKDQQTFERQYELCIKKYIANNPDNPDRYNYMLNLAYENMKRGDVGEKTEGLIRQGIGHLEGPEGYYLLSMLYYSRQKPEEALRFVEAAIKIRPESASCQLAGKILFSLKRYTQAEMYTDKALKMNPLNAPACLVKANIRLVGGDDATAWEYFDKAIRLDPGLPDIQEAYLGQAIILNSQKKFAEAVDRLKEAVRMKPDSPEMRYFLAVALIDAGRPQDARAELETALALKPGYGEAARLLGAVK
jgi:tetratricopeptide (TPR) repeat protein